MSDPRSKIPSVEQLLSSEVFGPLEIEFGRDRVVDAARRSVEEVRSAIGDAADEAALDEWREQVPHPQTYELIASAWLQAGDVPSLRRVINATGIVLHTNLGRAPLADVAVEAMRVAAGAYTNLEFDLDGGGRGSRYDHCVSLLTELTGAEDALVVNNAAGGLILALNTVALSQGVAVSRGELVEIGGGFRIPEVIERAGARLAEVGSTNRTRVIDYSEALTERGAGALLKVHRSNFRITGFTEEASILELAAVASEGGVPLVYDLGSGLMVDPESVGLPNEPGAAESLAAGADVVVVSGDKLLGGPQAGIIVGSSDLIRKMRKNPLCRALRVDKVTLAGLEATLRLYRDPPRAVREIPVLRMLSTKVEQLRTQVQEFSKTLAEAGVENRVVETTGAVGGGTFPGVGLPSWAVEVRVGVGASALAAALRGGGDTPVVARIVDDALRLDLRTVLPGQESELRRRVQECVAALAVPE
jgi:L-seryl-tRNA(Ser) seleniumtransferase